MPKVSQQQAQITRQRIIDCALEIILSSGIESLTFSNLAKQAQIGRSTINGHFSKKNDLLMALQPRLVSIIDENLCFDSADDFYNSWVHAIKSNQEFRQVIKVTGAFFDNDTGIAGLMRRFPSPDEDTEKAIYTAMGYAIVHLPKYT
ncbi:TetR/AcrR family transcriptional regulator [Psychrobium sp. nBUS_13]|uniref:TetR/AcrR family transcriptional regulator n=1 Tax=Psychrobium sp. nBUS_13 TaxID=3395319 RepID=UPI003EBA7C9A